MGEREHPLFLMDACRQVISGARVVCGMLGAENEPEAYLCEYFPVWKQSAFGQGCYIFCVWPRPKKHPVRWHTTPIPVSAQ